MKAEERHGLKTNELAEWIFSLPQQIKDNLQVILYVSAAVVLIVAAIFYYQYQSKTTAAKNQADMTRLISTLVQSKAQIVQAQAQGMDVSYNLIQTADELDDVAQKLKGDDASALALIKRGEALRMELHYRPSAVGQDVLKDQISKAKASYEQAVTKAVDDPLLLAKAKFGLGLCEEELGNFDAASKIYHEIANDRAFEGTVAVTEAKHRLRIMSDYQQPVTFKPAPVPPAPAAAAAPEVNAPMLQMMPIVKPAEMNQAGQK